MRVVPLGEVRPEVSTAAFLAAQRRPGNESRDGDEVTKTPLVHGGGSRRHRRVREGRHGSRQFLTGAKEADGAPHQSANVFRG